jgi:segregation and condensation protein B
VRELVPAVEALLFASSEALGVGALVAALGEVRAEDVREALAILRERHARAESGIELVEVAGGWQLRTDTRFGAEVARLRGARPQAMSKAALEVLAVVAWRQPVSRREIEAIRGVDSGAVLKTLIERGLVRAAGRKAEPGRPLTYGTTPAFLELFTLPDLGALPSLRERAEMAADPGQPVPGGEGPEGSP